MIKVPYYHLCDGHKMPPKKAYIDAYGKKDGKFVMLLINGDFQPIKSRKN